MRGRRKVSDSFIRQGFGTRGEQCCQLAVQRSDHRIALPQPCLRSQCVRAASGLRRVCIYFESNNGLECMPISNRHSALCAHHRLDFANPPHDVGADETDRLHQEKRSPKSSGAREKKKGSPVSKHLAQCFLGKWLYGDCQRQSPNYSGGPKASRSSDRLSEVSRGTGQTNSRRTPAKMLESKNVHWMPGIR